MERDWKKVQESEFSQGHVLTPGIKERIQGRFGNIARSVRVWIDGIEHKGGSNPPQDLEKSGVPRKPVPPSGESSIALPVPIPPEINTRVKDGR